jgi:hypothetical protein
LTFATEKEKPASERFMLISVSARLDKTGEETVFSGAVYKVPVHKKPSGFSVLNYDVASPPNVYYESAPYTEVFTNMPLAGEWYYDAAGGFVHFRQGSFDNRYYVAFTEYLTGSTFREAPKIPTTPGDNVLWKPLITKYPVVTKSISDITVGVLSQSLSTIDFINEGGFFNIYLSENATILNQQVKVWLCINSVADVKLIFSGKAATVNIFESVCSLSVLDPTEKLNSPATWGLGINGLTLSDSADYPYTVTTRPEDAGKLITRYLTRRSRHYFTGIVNYPDTTTIEGYEKGYCVDYTSTISTSTNRYWSLGVVKQDLSLVSNSMAVQVQSIGTITATVAQGSFIRHFNVSSKTNVYCGNMCSWEEGGTRRGRILRTDSYTYLGNTYNLQVTTETSGDNVATTSSTFNANPAMSIHVKSGNSLAHLYYGRDYTYSISNERGRFILTFVNNFEANYPGFFSGGAINPNLDIVYHYTHFSGPLGHADVLKSIVEAAGLTTNAASFSAAASALSAEVCFQIPFIDAGSISAYSDYAAKILESTGGYLTLNLDDEVEYHLFDPPTSSDTISDSEFSDFSVSVEYQDIFDEVIFSNPNFKNDSLVISSQAGDTNLFRSQNIKTRYLNNIVRSKSTTHALESMTNSIARVLWLNSNRKAKISFKTATKNIDSKPGDDIKIASDTLPGGVSTLDLKIVTVATSCESTAIEALDLADY